MNESHWAGACCMGGECAPVQVCPFKKAHAHIIEHLPIYTVKWNFNVCKYGK